MGETIMIVDDEPSICSSLGGALEDEGYRVNTASNGLEALNGDLACLDLRYTAMESDHVGELCADSKYWIQGRHRFLENHRNLSAPNRQHLGFGKPHQVTASEPDSPTDDAPRWLDQPHHGVDSDTLAATSFANQTDDLALSDVQ